MPEVMLNHVHFLTPEELETMDLRDLGAYVAGESTEAWVDADPESRFITVDPGPLDDSYEFGQLPRPEGRSL